jgi:hypothetical protein
MLKLHSIMWVGALAPTLWKCQAWSKSDGAEAPTLVYFEGTANELLRRISREELPTIIEYVPG